MLQHDITNNKYYEEGVEINKSEYETKYHDWFINLPGPVDVIEHIETDPEEKLLNIKAKLEAMRDSAVLPSTKAIYDAILELFEGVE